MAFFALYFHFYLRNIFINLLILINYTPSNLLIYPFFLYTFSLSYWYPFNSSSIFIHFLNTSSLNIYSGYTLTFYLSLHSLVSFFLYVGIYPYLPYIYLFQSFLTVSSHLILLYFMTVLSKRISAVKWKPFPLKQGKRFFTI